MREKVLKVVITFHTTTEAIAAEKAFREANKPGRLIPVPRQISSGCGLSWAALAQEKEDLLLFLAEQGLGYEAAGEYRI